jgi:ornithine decarboxylase
MPSGQRHYYINNGIYQGYMVRQFGEDMEINPVDKNLLAKRPKHLSTWWGQTCDSCDWIIKNKEHPEYKTGEWVMTENHGAYHKDLSCTFNGFDLPEVFYVY